jgi:hypothetical protein
MSSRRTALALTRPPISNSFCVPTLRSRFYQDRARIRVLTRQSVQQPHRVPRCPVPPQPLSCFPSPISVPLPHFLAKCVDTRSFGWGTSSSPLNITHDSFSCHRTCNETSQRSACVPCRSAHGSVKGSLIVPTLLHTPSASMRDSGRADKPSASARHTLTEVGGER